MTHTSFTPPASSRHDADRRAQHAAAFDAIGARYDEAFPDKHAQITAGQWLIDTLPTGARVLDVGCGSGQPTAAQLTAAGLHVVGTDISPVMLDLARAHVPAAEFLLYDALDLDEHLGQFDAAAAFFSLLMLSRADIPAALARIHARLASGGLLALGMIEANIDDLQVPFLGVPIHVTGYHRDLLTTTVQDAGFTVDTLSAHSYASPTGDTPDETQLIIHAHKR